MDVLTILDSVKEIIRPTDEHKIDISQFVKKVDSLLKKKGYDATCVIGGSVGKGTYLAGDYDVDIFVQFDYSYKNQDISELLGLALLPIKPIRLHGSRDYFQIHEKIIYELIPVLKIDNHKLAKNITDTSPLHTVYLKKKIHERPNIVDEIRLTKQFCKANKIYGAESYISGFSGHVIDILIVHYGSFLNLLRAASEEWKEKKIIDTEILLENPEKQINAAKHGPLIIVDPIQPMRNAAAALSQEKYELFKKSADSFLKNPKKEAFIIRQINEEYVLEKKKNYNNSIAIIISVIPRKEKKDISGAKVLKAYTHLQDQAREEGFKILDSNWEFNEKKAVLYFILPKEDLPETIDRAGPPIKSKRHYSEFTKKHVNHTLFIKDKKVYVTLKTPHRTFASLVDTLFQSKYFKDKIEEVISVRNL